jgi:putative ABC transport system permease protein
MLLKSFLKSTAMGVKRDPATTIIQIGGLVLALTVFLLITLWVSHQLSFDRFNKHADRIYRLEAYGKEASGWVGQHTMLPIYLKEKIPEIENFVRFRKWGKDLNQVLRYRPDNTIKNEIQTRGSFFFADTSFFNVFSFELLMGDPQSVLETPRAVVISDRIAQKLFENENPIGKTLISSGERTVTGIFKHTNNFHIKGDWILTISSLGPYYKSELPNNPELDNWEMADHPTYLLLKKGTDPLQVEKKMKTWIDQIETGSWPEDTKNYQWHLRPLTDIYFNGATQNEGYYTIHGNSNMVLAFIAIALFILLVACINFVNLSTAKSANRAREIGVRKVNGSTKSELVSQFMLEIFVYCLLAFGISLTLIQFLLTYFNNLIQGDLSLEPLQHPQFWLYAIAGIMAVTFLAGFVPSYLYAKMKPASVMREYTSDTKKSLTIRRSMMIGQYIVSTVLVIATLLVYKQLHFMKTADPGFKQEQRITFSYQGSIYGDQLQAFKERLLTHPDIISLTQCFGLPGEMLPYGPNIKINEQSINVRRIVVDEHYFQTLDVPVIEGRNFEKQRGGDVFDIEQKVNRIILNETAVKAFKLKKPIGSIGYVSSAGQNDRQFEIIGVVKDFHFSSMKEKIPPIFFYFSEGSDTYSMILHVNTTNINAVNKHLRQTIFDVFPEADKDFKLQYRFLENFYNAQYTSEEKLGELFIYFTILAVFIACLGLYGLSSYSISKRTREIAIRKSNGALIPEIFVLVIKDYLIWIAIAFVVALPVGYWVMNRWLQEFAYHINVNWQTLAESCGITLVVAIITVLYQTLKASLAKPAQALKYE